MADDQLDLLLKRRFGGAAALSGFRFQLVYSLFRLFDLFDEDQQITHIAFEGIEDVDLQSLQIGNTYIQVKASSGVKGWGWFSEARILDKFWEVYRIDPTARFLVITNFDFKGDLQRLAEFTWKLTPELPAPLKKELLTIAQRCNTTVNDIQQLIGNLQFEKHVEAGLQTEIKAAIIKYFDVTAGNEELYGLALFAEVLKHASDREPLKREEVEGLRLQIKDWISLGTINPVVQEGWIQPLVFEEEPRTLDYYAGKSARPSHILASLDARRPLWGAKIQAALDETPVCVVRASSGQGKSTLLLRYAFDHYNEHSIFLLKRCDDISMVQQTTRYLKGRLKLGLPVLVLVDDLNERVKEWGELAGDLAGELVSFLIASREENWFRYATKLDRISWSSIFPELTFDEAKDIFSQFANANRLAENVNSAAWAYEKLGERKLLMEYVFLITHGQMLSERLQEQVKMIHLSQEDSVKLAILRLTSLAQFFDVRVEIRLILARLTFRDDPQMVIESLQGEYLIVENGLLEGLHYVRSEHLVHILHPDDYVSATLSELIELVSITDLPILIRSAFSETSLRIDKDTLLDRVIAKTMQNTLLILETVTALFDADELNYILTNKSIYDEVFSLRGNSALYLFSSVTAPRGDRNILNALAAHGDIPRLIELRDQLQERNKDAWFARQYLSRVIDTIDDKYLLANLDTFATLGEWSNYLQIEFNKLAETFDSNVWKIVILNSTIRDGAGFLSLLWELNQARYLEFVQESKPDLIYKFMEETKTISVSEQDVGINIEFIVNERQNTHDQALERLDLLDKWLPHYEWYGSQGLYPLSDVARLGHDETHKHIPRANLANAFSQQLNSAYWKDIQFLYTPKLLHEWIEYWWNFRKSAMAFIKALLERRERQIARKNTSDLRKEIEPLLRNSVPLPFRFNQRFASEESAINGWFSDFVAFIRSYSEDAYSRHSFAETRLNRLNIRSLIVKTIPMQAAFRTIIRSELSNFQPFEIDSEEYKYLCALSDAIEYWIATPANRVLGSRVKPQAAISAWKKQQNRAFRQALQLAFQPLSEAGWHIYLPEDFLEEGILQNICLGFELTDASNPYFQLDSVFACLATFPVDYTFVYAMPVIKRIPYHKISFRAAKDVVGKVAKAEIAENKIVIFPVIPPQGFFDVVPEIENRELSETKFFAEANELLGSLPALRNETYFINSRLSSERFGLIRNRGIESITERLAEASAKSKHLKDRALSFKETTNAQDQWAGLWSYFDTRWVELSVEVLNAIDYQPVIEDIILLQLYGDYLNHRYILSH